MAAEALQLLDKAEKELRTADHIIYITFPLIKEARLLRTLLDQLYKIAEGIVRAILNYEFICKRSDKPSSDPLTPNSLNWELLKKCSLRFNIAIQELQQLKELLELYARHRSSSFEFIRRNKLIIVENTKAESISIEQLKSHLNLLRALLLKAKAIIVIPDSSDRYK